MGDRKESSLEIAKPTSIKSSDPFMRIWKKIGPMLNLEAIRQTALAITSSGEEEEALTPRKRAPSQKGKEKGIKKPSLVVVVQPNPSISGICLPI